MKAALGVTPTPLSVIFHTLHIYAPTDICRLPFPPHLAYLRHGVDMPHIKKEKKEKVISHTYIFIVFNVAL